MSEMKQWRGEGGKIAFVPTMGGVHRGHLALVELAQKKADRVVVSVFVNPAQFGENEDFAEYPRTLDADLALLAGQGVDCVFMPDVREVYPQGVDAGFEVGESGQILCGKTRPHFFNGVAQVVRRLFAIVRPDVAVFGQKDYQQLMVIRQMVEAQALDIEILSADTVRESDGLAISTRNQYLSDEQRQVAPVLYSMLDELRRHILAGGDIINLTKQTRKALEKHFKIDYLSVLDANTLSAITGNTGKIAILCAVFLGSTRLIDNIIFKG